MVNKISLGYALDVTRDVPDEFVDCVVTSPPYWQLRDYGFEGQWGAEKTYQEYLEHLWSLMDEIKRVLKPTGTVWINLGDTYGGSWGNYGKRESKQRVVKKKRSPRKGAFSSEHFPAASKAPAKCQLLIPHRFAIGCIDRNWIVRNDIVWAKRNGIQESVKDRFSKKHEYVFFMTKNKKYYFDLDGVKDARTAKNKAGKNPGTISDFWDIPVASGILEAFCKIQP